MAVKRVNITLPEDVLQILKKKVKPGDRSSYIADAVRSYAKKQSKELFVREMIEGYKATAQEDLGENQVWEVALNDGSDD